MNETDVIIVGGGPVGLFLGCVFAKLNIPFIILEAQTKPPQASRAIGIHPPALERFAELGLSDAFLAQGVKVTGGQVFSDTRRLGRLSFESCPGPFPFVLTVSQAQTEALLRACLQAHTPGALQWGEGVTRLEQRPDDVIVTTSSTQYQARYVIGCDGKNSTVRQQLGIDFAGGRYPDTYIMADACDTTELGEDAAIFLCRAGLVESFPLKGGLRRWVVKTERYLGEPMDTEIGRYVKTRTGIDLPERTCAGVSAFGVQHYLAKSFVSGRVLLCGDAAHVISPIGGQGMNLGWLDAWEAAHAVVQALAKNSSGVLQNYNERRQLAARRATARAALNMRLGRSWRLTWLRNSAAWCMVNTPLERHFARLFTMRGL
jgi:2-polyprenyl-6-methoxyphenol hydroxylase-like FAD-dependent oxidoreductase